MAGYRTFFYRSPAIKSPAIGLKKVQSPDFLWPVVGFFFLTVTGLFLAGYRTFFTYRSPAIKSQTVGLFLSRSPDFFMAGSVIERFFYRSPAIKRSGDRTFLWPVIGSFFWPIPGLFSRGHSLENITIDHHIPAKKFRRSAKKVGKR